MTLKSFLFILVLVTTYMTPISVSANATPITPMRDNQIALQRGYQYRISTTALEEPRAFEPEDENIQFKASAPVFGHSSLYHMAQRTYIVDVDENQPEMIIEFVWLSDLLSIDYRPVGNSEWTSADQIIKPWVEMNDASYPHRRQYH